MLFFGLCFLTYFIKLSGKNGFWSNLRSTDPVLHQKSKALQRVLKKKRKAEHDIKFLNACKENDVYPKFVKWKNIKNLSYREKKSYYIRLLNEALQRRHNDLRYLKQKYESIYLEFTTESTWMKRK